MLARAASHALNYAPLNYEWHGIMEIINGVRFADTNEEPARRGLLHALMRISRRQEFTVAPQDALITKSSLAITVVDSDAYYSLPRVANSHAIRAAGSIVRLICGGKGEFRFHRVDDVTVGRGRAKKINGNARITVIIFSGRCVY